MVHVAFYRGQLVFCLNTHMNIDRLSTGWHPCDFHRAPNAMVIICSTVIPGLEPRSQSATDSPVCDRHGQTIHPQSHLEQTILLKTDSTDTGLYGQHINGL